MLLKEREYYKPFQYPWAFENYKKQQQMHWMPEEVTMADDIKDYNEKLSADNKQLVDNMFGEECDSSTTTCPTSGTSQIEGATIAWVKDTTTEEITLTITADDGTITTMVVPIGDFKF